MTGAFKMLLKKAINIFRLCDSTIVFTKPFLQSSTSLSNILHITIQYFKLKLDPLIFRLTTENVLPFTDGVIVVLEHK